MAKGPQYRVSFRRRRQNKTNYYLRRKLLISRRNRFVVRKSSRHTIVQLIAPHIDGDKAIVNVTTKELVKNYGWKASTGNLSAAYVAGYLVGKRALAKKYSEAILDLGLSTPIRGSRLFAALKGAIDAGMNIPHSTDVLPSEERIRGKHIIQYYQSISKEKPSENKQQFNKVKSGGLDINKLSEHIEEVLKKIDSDVVKKPTVKLTTKSSDKKTVKKIKSKKKTKQS